LQYKVGEGDRNKVALLVWGPDASPVKQRMLVASNKDSIKGQLQGVHIEFQGAKHADLDLESWTDQAKTALK